MTTPPKLRGASSFLPALSFIPATVALDVRLQSRNQLYRIGIGVALGIGLAARFLLEPEVVDALLPGLWLGAVGSTTFLFVAGMILFEKSERTLDALVVTPLPRRAYLSSKVLTLSGFAMVESILVLLLARGFGDVSWLPLLLGLALLGALYTLVAIGQVASQSSVTDFLVPGGILTLTVLQVPFLDAFGIWSHAVLYLVPTQAAVVLMKGGFADLASWQWIYALVYGVLSLLLAGRFAGERFRRHAGSPGGGS